MLSSIFCLMKQKIELRLEVLIIHRWRKERKKRKFMYRERKGKSYIYRKGLESHWGNKCGFDVENSGFEKPEWFRQMCCRLFIG